MPPSLTYAERPADVYPIGCDRKPSKFVHADASLENIGCKAFGLLEMSQLGLPVPPAFVLGTGYSQSDVMRQLATKHKVWTPGSQQIELASDRRFGGTRAPLLLTVHSGIAVSMSRMLEALLNIGLCDATLSDLLRQTDNPRLVWDTCRRPVVNYGEVVEGITPQVFETEYSMVAGATDEVEQFDFAQLRELARRSLRAYVQAAGRPFPQNPEAQLTDITQAVLVSWDTQKAHAYRYQYQIDENIGTAATIQGVVFGNGGGSSGAGAGFTRNSTTGEPAIWVDFLFSTQGEDVVPGRRHVQGHTELARAMPRLQETLCGFGSRVEQAFGDMQDSELTIQDARPYLLQARNGKRTPETTVRIVLNLLDEGITEAATAQERTAGVDPTVLVRHRVAFGDDSSPEPLAHATSACSGVAVGGIVLDETATRVRQAVRASVILVRSDAWTSDLTAIQIASGLLTQRGARTSHTAVVTRQPSKVYLIGCEALRMYESTRAISSDETTLQEGDSLTSDGDDGFIYAGEFSMVTELLADLQARLAQLRTGGMRAQSHDQRLPLTPSTRGSCPASAATEIRKLLQVALQRAWVENGLSLRRNSNVSREGTRNFA